MKKGFSLIEALLVIAIIAILAAMLLPIFMRHRIANGLHVGDRVVIKTLNVRGIVDHFYNGRVTIIAIGNDGYPVKLDSIDVKLLEKQ